MFTGLVEALAPIHTCTDDGNGGTHLSVRVPEFAEQVTIGASVAVNGCCLTVVAREAETLSFQAGPETLARTDLGTLRPGDFVNLERALCLGDRLGGHLVQGHIDGTGQIAARTTQGDWQMLAFRCDRALTAHMVAKGSIAVDGVSLTLVDVTAEGFTIMLIPHTLAVTTLGRKAVGAVVNLETDLLAKYVHKAMQAYLPEATPRT